VKKIALLTAILLIPLALASYTPNENVNFILLLTDIYGNPIQNASCVGYVYYPNMTLYAELPLQYSNGIYYSQFTTPDVYGTYLETAMCNYTLYGKQRTIFAYNYIYVSQSLDVLEQRLRNISENASVNVLVNITGEIQNVTNITLDKLDELLAVLIALHSTPVTQSYCIDEYHLLTVKEAKWQIGNRIIPVIKNETIYCEYGCNNETNQCNPAPYIKQSFVLGLIVLIIGLIVFAIKYLW